MVIFISREESIKRKKLFFKVRRKWSIFSSLFVYMVGFLSFNPVSGAIANGEFVLSHLIILLITGFLAHIFAFVQSDIYDVEIDSKSKYVSNRPLAKGIILKRTVGKMKGGLNSSVVKVIRKGLDGMGSW